MVKIMLNNVSAQREKCGDAVPCVAVSTDPNNGEAGHRCYGCSEYPELAGPFAVAVALDSTGFKWSFCAKCVRAMANALNKAEDESSLNSAIDC